MNIHERNQKEVDNSMKHKFTRAILSYKQLRFFYAPATNIKKQFPHYYGPTAAWRIFVHC